MKNSVAIVTGASQGIGRSTAIRLAQDFSAVVLAARNGAELEEVATEVRKSGAEPLTIALDLSLPDSPETVVKTTLDRYGRIDALAEHRRSCASDRPLRDDRRAMDRRNGAETPRGSQADDPRLGCAQGKQGIGRLHVRQRGPRSQTGFAAVAATNAAIIALAKAFAEQGIKDGVQVNSIMPGAVMTGRRRSFLEKWAPAHNMSVEEATKKFPEEAGISRYGQPEEIADLLAFMVSPAAKWMTGTSVRMDGGETKGI